MIRYLLYLCARFSYSSFVLYSWSFLAVIVCNSVFTVTESYSVSLVNTTRNVYYFIELLYFIGYLFFCIKNLSLRFFPAKHSILVLLYCCSALLSVAVNHSHISGPQPFYALLNLLMAVFPSLILVKFLQPADLPRIQQVMLVFALINIAVATPNVVFDANFLGILDNSAFFADRSLFVRFLCLVTSFVLIRYALVLKSNGRFINRYLFLFLVLFLCVVFQFSRSGYLMFFIVSGTLIFSTPLKKSFKPYIFPFLGVVLVLFVSMTLVRIKKEKMNVADFSDYQRIVLMKTGLNMIKKNPVAGIGYGMVEMRYSEFADKSLYSAFNLTAIHNIYIGIFAEQGIIGLVIFLLLNGSLLVAHYRRYKTLPFEQGHQSLFCLIAMGIYLFHGLFYHVFDSEGMYWIIIAMSIILLKDGTRITSQSQKAVTFTNEPIC